jgi:hypothetical protein
MRNCKQLLDDLKEIRGYWKLKEEALDCTTDISLWKGLWTCHKTDYRMNERMDGCYKVQVFIE